MEGDVEIEGVSSVGESDADVGRLAAFILNANHEITTRIEHRLDRHTWKRGEEEKGGEGGEYGVVRGKGRSGHRWVGN